MLVFGSVLGVAAYLLTTRLAHSSLESVVDTRVREVRSQVTQLADDATELVGAEFASPVAIQVVKADGSVLAQSPGVPATARLCEPADGYLVVSRLAATPTGEVTICAAASLKPVERVQAGVLLALAIMLPVALLGVGLAVWIAVGRALRSVDDLRRQAESMTSVGGGTLVIEPTGDEVEHLGTTLNGLIARLRAQTMATQQFVADAGHELRNPLATLRVSLEFDDGSPGSHELALAELDRLEELVTDLLVLARSDAQDAPPLVEVELDAVVRAAVSARAATRPEITVSTDLCSAMVVGDRRALRSAVENLLANAMRHASTRVRVRLSRAASSWLLAIDDDGLGLAQADCDRVFDRFVRLDESRVRDEGGSGLGLALVAAVAGAHGGRAWAAPGPGGHFRLLIPVAPEVVEPT
jgi:signal transduction histidine kinase